MSNYKNDILSLLSTAEDLIPKTLEKDLPAYKINSGIPQWHNYESDIWGIGEEIRQLLILDKKLRKDIELLDRIVTICLNPNSKRGRQSFIMLLWYKHCNIYADTLIGLINDKYVYGHLIQGLNKMTVKGYSRSVEPHTKDKIAWIRKQAVKYIEFDGI